MLPPSGSRPMRAKACRNEADLPAMAMSAASAKLMPTPAATPFTAATMGLGIVRMVRITGLKNFSSAAPESAVALAVAVGIGQVGAGAEAAARAGQQHGAHGAVGRELLPADLISAIILRETAFSLSGALRVSVARPSALTSSDLRVGHRLIVL